MKQFLSISRLSLLALLFLSLAPTLSAQDLTLSCVTAGPRTEGDVTLNYKWYDKGANIYYSETMDYNLTISSTREIVRIEFEGTTDKSGSVIVRDNNGTLDFQPKGTSIWEGQSSNIVFTAASAATDYYISTLRIWFAGSTALCDKPVITYTSDGRLLIDCPTPEATCHYTVTPNVPTTTGTVQSALPLQTFTIAAHAEVEGKAPSETETRTLTQEELVGTNTSSEVLVLRADGPRTFQRNKVLVEKHTGLNCSNCPPADNAYNAYIKAHEGYAERTILMRHNSYSPDALQIASIHTALSSKWGISGWPKYLIDRAGTDGSRYSNPHGYHVSWGEWQTASFDGVGKRLNTPTYVSLSLEGSAYNPATKKLIVRARGEVTTDVPDLAVNVFLTQDSINGSTDHAYSKSTRACLTKNLFGDPITVENGWYDIYYEYTLEDTYGRFAADPEKMNLVVFITSYDDYTYPFEDGKKDFTYSEVHNADEVRITSLPETTGPRCATPKIALKDGALVFPCSVPEVVITYTLTPIEAVATPDTDLCPAPAFKVTAIARAEGYTSSDPASATFTLDDIKKSFTHEDDPTTGISSVFENSYPNPSSSVSTSDSHNQIIDSRSQISNSRSQISNSRSQISNSPNQISNSRNQIIYDLQGHTPKSGALSGSSRILLLNGKKILK